MALQYPGIAYLKGYDGKVSDILDQWNTGLEAGRNDKDEANAGDLIAKLFGAQNGAGAQPPQGGGLYDGIVNGSVDAAQAAQDPMLSAYFANTRRSESGGNDSAKNPNSSATGRYQFLDSTWQGLAEQHPELGLTPDGRNDPGQQERAMKAFTMDNARQLKGSGVGVNPGSLYAAHFLGAGGASKVLSADPNTPIASLVGPEVVQANPQLANMTVGEFQQWAASNGGNGNGGYAGPVDASEAGASAGAGGGDVPPELMAQLFSNRTTRPFVIEMMKAKAKADGGGGDLGLNPQFGVDAEGNPVIIQLGKDGNGVQTKLPPGVTLSKEPIKLDAGTHYVLLDPITRQPVGTIPKDNYGEGYDRAAGGAAGKFDGEQPERKLKATTAMGNYERQTGVVTGALDKAIAAADNNGLFTTGFLGDLSKGVAGTPAFDLAQTLNTINANIGFDTLAAMREASPTGGALGAISDTENKLLQAVNGATAQGQSRDQFKANMQEIKRLQAQVLEERKAAFDKTFGTSFGPAVGTIEDGHRFKGGNPADPDRWEQVQ